MSSSTEVRGVSTRGVERMLLLLLRLLLEEDLVDLVDFLDSSDVMLDGMEAPPVPALGRFDTENVEDLFVGVGEEALLERELEDC